jgi:hypothetical protein
MFDFEKEDIEKLSSITIKKAEEIQPKISDKEINKAEEKNPGLKKSLLDMMW